MNTISSATTQNEGSVITLNGLPVLDDVTADIAVVADSGEMGLFLRIHAASSACRHLFPLGKLCNLRRFTCCYRTNLFFMSACAGSSVGSVPVETQYLLYERHDGQYVLLLPLLDGAFRCSFTGNADDDRLYLIAESGDPTVVEECITGVYLAVGEDPYRLMESAATYVMARMRTGRLRREKALPDFIDKFGWCTWDAFYQQVSHDKVREGLQSFADGGVSPAFMILDDGWQSILPGGDMRLTAFAANEKFPGGLAKTVSMAKEEFGVERFLVWHAILGYWNGIDSTAFPQYPSREVTQHFSPSIASYLSPEQAATTYIDGLVLPEAIHRFYQDFHRSLRLMGVDGVKVDCQAVLEVIAHELGGRVALTRIFHEALEGSVQAQLLGNLLNCMSCSNDMIYSALNSNITRSSTDYAPRDEDSHGTHLYFNAQASFWMGEFVHPDWDMFQSGHPWGAYHAAARAISGGPVYVSDTPDGHDFAVLRKVVLSDGSVPRPLLPARPTRDCLFHDPTTEPVLLKIFSHNRYAGVLGIFNAHAPDKHGEAIELTGEFRPADITELRGERFAVWAHNSESMVCRDKDDALQIALPVGGFEVYTVAPIVNRFAPIGLVDKYNSAGAISAYERDPLGTRVITLRDGGRFVAWCACAPRQVLIGDTVVAFSYEASSGTLRVDIPSKGKATLRISW